MCMFSACRHVGIVINIMINFNLANGLNVLGPNPYPFAPLKIILFVTDAVCVSPVPKASESLKVPITRVTQHTWTSTCVAGFK